MLVPVYGPTALASLGYGALAPIVALAATNLGANSAIAALCVGVPVLGQLIGDLPAGVLADRLGERRALLIAGTVDAIAMAGAYFATSLVVLVAALGVSGLAASVFSLARHAWITVAIPLRFRARALSSLGGTMRIGGFVGPFVGAALVSVFPLRSVFLFAAAAGLAATILTLTMRELPAPEPAQGTPAEPTTMRVVLRRHRRALATLGVGVLLICAARMARPSLLPLWAESQHLDASTISLLFGFASGLELVMVYPGGAIMDRFGRAFVAIPAITAIGVGFAVLPLTHSAVTIGAVACLMALGNGLSAGIVMTLGSDAAPDVGRSQFLGAWRFLADAGGLAGPGLVSAVTALGALGPAAFTMAAVCFAGAAWVRRFAPRRQDTVILRRT